MKKTLMSSAIALLATGALTANAQEGIQNWTYDALWDDERMTDFLGAEVFTTGGEEIGNVEDVFLNESGEIQTVVVGTGGILFTDEYVHVPWQDVSYYPVDEALRIPMTEEQVEALEKNESIDPGPNQWSANTLIDMTANVDGTAPYGEVDDLMFDPALAKVEAIVVEEDIWDPERYALPWGGAVFDRIDEGQIYFPYTEADLQTIAVFVYPTDTNNQQNQAQNPNPNAQQQGQNRSPNARGQGQGNNN